MGSSSWRRIIQEIKKIKRTGNIKNICFNGKNDLEKNARRGGKKSYSSKRNRKMLILTERMLRCIDTNYRIW